MSLQLYNTLTRKKENFAPIDPQHVKMYVCGPTVYDFAHLGNARPVAVFDTLYRLLKTLYPKVTYARNITDVDDKIMAKAKETGETINEVTTRTTKAYHEDMAAIMALSPDVEPRCTQHIPHMIAMIEKLIAKGHAYAVDGHVLFNVPSMPEYGELSRRSRDELIAGARVEVAPYKKDAADFVLWKPSSAEQVGWDSPWGRGRPGWHIECSAMSEAHLGETFDIHGGGLDLIFPHHENEIAQSRCAHDGKPLAKLWMHNGFLTIDNDKMSKSLGNFFTVRDLLAHAPGEALRFALLAAHYRQPLDFSRDALRQAKDVLDGWYGTLRSHASIALDKNVDVPHAVVAALTDDLNTPQAIAALHDLAGQLNKNPSVATKSAFVKAANLIGFLTQDPEAWLRWAPKGTSQMSEAEIEAQIEARLAARKARDFKKADQIRNDLLAMGVILEDKAEKTLWRRV